MMSQQTHKITSMPMKL